MAMGFCSNIYFAIPWTWNDFYFWAHFIYQIMNETLWRDIAIGAMGILEIVIIGVISRYFSQLDKRMDKQDDLLEKANNAHTQNTIILTDHSRRIIHLESNHIVRYPERNG